MLLNIFKKRGGFLVVLLVLSAFNVYSHEGEAFDESGTTPDSFFYNVDLFFENTALTFTTSPEAKAELEAQYAHERFDEMHAMIDSGDYQAAQEASVYGEQLLVQADEHIEQILPTQTTTLEQVQQGESRINDVLQIQTVMVENNIASTELKEELAKKVESGDISIEQAASLIDNLRQDVVEVETTLVNKEDALVSDIALKTTTTELEIEILVDKQKQEQGVFDVYQEKITQERLIALQNAILDIQNDYRKAQEEGQFQDESTLRSVLDQADLKFQIAHDAYENGDYGKAFGQFTAAEHLVLNVDRVLASPQQERQNVIEKLQVYALEHPSDITQDRIQESKKYVEDYEKIKDELIIKYPDKAEQLQRNYEQANRIITLSQKLEDSFSAEYERLTTQEKKTPAEADAILRDRFVEEYRAAYGKEFTPPGFVTPGVQIEEIPIGQIPDGFGQPGTTIQTPQPTITAAFVEGYEYTDPNSGYKYEFAKDGYKYTTPFGETYDYKYPEGYTHPSHSYETGNEVHSYEYQTPEGIVKYEYSATGYSVTKPDGSTQTYTYLQGEYTTLSGDKIEIKPTGFEIKSQTGRNIEWDYNPEYNNYVSSSVDDVYVPPEGASYHIENTKYESDQKSYTYEHSGETWTYNPSSHTWTSSGGESYKPQATTIAPTGYESHGSYTTETGTTWTYDSTSGTWASSGGETYTPSTSSYTTGSGTSYYYDPSTSTYVDTSGKTYSPTSYSSDTSGTSGTSSTYSYFDPSTGSYHTTTTSYTYDSSTGTYTPSDSTTYSGTGTYGGTSYSGTSYTGDTSTSYSGSYSGYTSDTSTSSTSTSGSYSGGDSGGSTSTSTSSGGGGGGGDGGGGGTPTGAFIYDVLSYRTFKSTQTTSNGCCPCN